MVAPVAPTTVTIYIYIHHHVISVMIWFCFVTAGICTCTWEKDIESNVMSGSDREDKPTYHFLSSRTANFTACIAYKL